MNKLKFRTTDRIHWHQKKAVERRKLSRIWVPMLEKKLKMIKILKFQISVYV